MTETVVTRFAPSPTGFLHIGGARTALFNWLYARGRGGKMLLRIEDTDRERSTEAAIEAILDGLSWLGLDWDSETVYQFSRSARHREVAEALLAAGHAYRCYASPEELAQMREKARSEGRAKLYDGRWRDRDPSVAPPGIKPVIRFKAPLAGETAIEDQVQGRVVWQNENLDDLVLLRSDGTPTYMLAVVVDDHDMGITHVIRGDDHLTNAARQTQIYNALGWKVPVMAHIPLIHGPDGSKLSKRHGALGVDAYRAMGYLPAAMRNYLVRLGWSHGDQEIFSTEEMVAAFDLPQIGRSPARFDFAKLESLNGHYMRQTGRCRSPGRDRARAAAHRRRSRARRQVDAGDAREAARGHAGLEGASQDPGRAGGRRPLHRRRSPARRSMTRPRGCSRPKPAICWPPSRKTSRAIEPGPPRRPKQAVRAFAERKGVKLGSVAQPLRAALTGRTTSPPIFDVLAVLGKVESLGRLQDQVLRYRGPQLARRSAGNSGCRPRDPCTILATRSHAVRRAHLAAHTGLSYAKSASPAGVPKQPFQRSSGECGPPGDTTEGSIMDAKTGANIKSGKFVVGDKEQSFPIYEGTIGPSVIDIGKFYAETGMFTYDPGYTSTGSCESKITYIDGDEGILLYRGYPIEQLAEHGDFLETCYLLLYGELPTAAQKSDFDDRVTRHTMVHEQMSRFYQGLPARCAPDGGDDRLRRRALGVLSRLDRHLRSDPAHDRFDPHDRQDADAWLRWPTSIRSASRSSIRRTISTTQPTSCACALRCRARSTSPTPLLARAMDRIFILHADHEQNASTSTVRLAGSSGANPFACIAAGCACLWGPAHGGANEAALNMLREIGKPERIPEYIRRAKDKNDSFRLMGFGHRVYKNYDPRAKIMQKTCHEVLSEIGIKDDPLLDVALELERIALHDDYFIEKKLYPNIDFYSGITLKAMGFPTTMFTVLFAVARTVGWISQWKEMIEDPHQKIGRPRQLYTGATQRDYVPISRRK